MRVRRLELPLLTIASTALIILAAWLRLERLGVPALWLDEILNVDIIRALNVEPFEWLIGFERENGPLYFGLHSMGLRSTLPVEQAFRLPEAIAGVLGVALIGLAGFRSTGSRMVGLMAAALLAVSPIHVYYSREGRPYALLVIATIWLTHSLAANGLRARPADFVGGLLFAAVIAATAAPLLLTVLAISVVEVACQPSGERKPFRVVAAFVALGYLTLLYARFAQPTDAAPFRATLSTLGAELLNSWVITSGNADTIATLTLTMCTFAVWGFVRMGDRRAARILAGTMLLLPLVTLVALVARNHWYSTRYTVLGLVPFLILAAAGIVDFGRSMTSFLVGRTGLSAGTKSVVSGSIVVLVALLVCRDPLATSRNEPFERVDWRRIARILASHADEGAFVLAADDWSGVCLRFYLGELGRSLDVRSAGGSLDVARGAVARRPFAWIVSGGYGTDREIREWACRYYLVARDEAENVKLHFAPDLATFLEHAATPSEKDRFVARFLAVHGGRFEMEPAEDPFFRGAWFGSESAGGEEFRWSGESSSIVLPVPGGPAVMRFQAAAFGAPDRAQTLTVLTDGLPLIRTILVPETRAYEVDLPRSPGASLLTIDFRFEWETSPADLGISTDDRPLSASFDWIEVKPDKLGAVANSRADRMPILFSVDGALSEPTCPCDEICSGELAWDGARLSTLAMNLGRHPAEIAQLRTRLQFAHAVVDSLQGSDCLPNETFVRNLYPVLLARRADRAGVAFYLAGMREGWSRDTVVCRMTQGQEFSDLWLRAQRNE